MHIRPHQVVQLIQDSVNHFHQQMSLLRVSGGHKQRQKVIKKWPCTKFTSIDGDLPEARFSHLRISIFYLKQKGQDFPFLLFLDGEILLIDIFQERREEFILLWLD